MPWAASWTTFNATPDQQQQNPAVTGQDSCRSGSHLIPMGVDLTERINSDDAPDGQKPTGKHPLRIRLDFDQRGVGIEKFEFAADRIDESHQFGTLERVGLCIQSFCIVDCLAKNEV